MKKISFLKYPIVVIIFLLVLFSFDALFGKTAGKSFWQYFIEGVAFLIALLLADVAEKHGWDTWSGLISKFKKNT